jgi:hypothetical protein
MSTYVGGGGGDAVTATAFIDAAGNSKRVSTADPLPVNIQGATLSLDADGIEIKNDSGNPIPVVTGLEIPEHDYIDLSYTGSNLTGVVYKTGGSQWHHGGDADLGVRRQRQPDIRHQELSHGSQVQPIYRQP